MTPKFPNFRQIHEKDCGPTCIRIISKYYGKDIAADQLRLLFETTASGTSFLGLAAGAEKIGFKTAGIKTNFNTLKGESVLPCIIHWNNKHFVVLCKITDAKVYVSDPALGLTYYVVEEFLDRWIGEGATRETGEGVALVLETTPSFFLND